MSKQWGHGYYKGVEDVQTNSGTLAGLWFHSRKNGKINWQGYVVRDLKNSNYVVQLFDWLTGAPTIQKVIPFEQMAKWDFYPTALSMRWAYNKYEGLSEEDFESGERLIKMLR